MDPHPAHTRPPRPWPRFPCELRATLSTSEEERDTSSVLLCRPHLSRPQRVEARATRSTLRPHVSTRSAMFVFVLICPLPSTTKNAIPRTDNCLAPASLPFLYTLRSPLANDSPRSRLRTSLGSGLRAWRGAERGPLREAWRAAVFRRKLGASVAIPFAAGAADDEKVVGTSRDEEGRSDGHPKVVGQEKRGRG